MSSWAFELVKSCFYILKSLLLAKLIRLFNSNDCVIWKLFKFKCYLFVLAK